MKVLFLSGSPKKTGATAALVQLAGEAAAEKGHDCRFVWLGEKNIQFCTGCKRCYQTGSCFRQDDDVAGILDQFQWADAVAVAIPSYWGDMPGQMKAFVDRCTPVGNTNAARTQFFPDKTGFGLALRTGPGQGECERLVERIEHFLGHLDIPMVGSAYFCGIEDEGDILARREEILKLCSGWF